MYSTYVASDWKLAFKAVANVLDPDPYELWTSTDQNNAPLQPSYARTCQLITPTSLRKHCKLYDILNWDNLNVNKVSIVSLCILT